MRLTSMRNPARQDRPACAPCSSPTTFHPGRAASRRTCTRSPGNCRPMSWWSTHLPGRGLASSTPSSRTRWSAIPRRSCCRPLTRCAERATSRGEPVATRRGSALPPPWGCLLLGCAGVRASAGCWPTRTATRSDGPCCPGRGRCCAGSGRTPTSSPTLAPTPGPGSRRRSARTPSSCTCPAGWTRRCSRPRRTVLPSGRCSAWGSGRSSSASAASYRARARTCWSRRCRTSGAAFPGPPCSSSAVARTGSGLRGWPQPRAWPATS